MKNLKKILIVFLAVLFVSPVIVNGANLTVTTTNSFVNELPNKILIKTEDSNTVYWYSDGKRYVFPNEKTYKTWFDDYSGVNEISKERLSQIPLAENITYRPASRLVKIQTDPNVYVVGPNSYLHLLTDEDVARQLYGKDWNTLVDDLPITLFTNYKFGDPISEPFYVDGSVITYGNGGSVYVIENGKKRQIMDENTMDINYFSNDLIFTSSPSLVFENGESLLGSSKFYTDLTQSLERWDGKIQE